MRPVGSGCYLMGMRFAVPVALATTGALAGALLAVGSCVGYLDVDAGAVASGDAALDGSGDSAIARPDTAAPDADASSPSQDAADSGTTDSTVPPDAPRGLVAPSARRLRARSVRVRRPGRPASALPALRRDQLHPARPRPDGQRALRNLSPRRGHADHRCHHGRRDQPRRVRGRRRHARHPDAALRGLRRVQRRLLDRALAQSGRRRGRRHQRLRHRPRDVRAHTVRLDIDTSMGDIQLDSGTVARSSASATRPPRR